MHLVLKYEIFQQYLSVDNKRRQDRYSSHTKALL
jgi:hypothetical protein